MDIDMQETLGQTIRVVVGQNIETAVRDINAHGTQDTSAPAYDLSGRRITSGTRGIQIHRGHKVIIR